MAEHDEDVPYRSPIDNEEADPVSTEDETDYSTLRRVKREFDQALYDLKHDFNAFDLANDIPVDAQIRARQEAYTILEPLQATLKSAVDDIKTKYKGQ